MLLGFSILLLYGVKKYRNSSKENFLINDIYKNSLEWAQISDIIKSQKYEYYLLFYFKNICLNCPSGDIILKLNDLHKLYDYLYIVVMLPEEFSENDIKNLEANLEIKYRLVKITKSFSEKWNRWLSRGNKKGLYYGAILLDREGQIILNLLIKKENERNYFDKLIKKMANNVK